MVEIIVAMFVANEDKGCGSLRFQVSGSQHHQEKSPHADIPSELPDKPFFLVSKTRRVGLDDCQIPRVLR